jgi:exodeoxyribonuclease VII large subunit
VVGVGHERDETLADYVADVRASTPTNAAEIVVPERRDVESFINGSVAQMEMVLGGMIASKKASIDAMTGRIEAHIRARSSDFSHLVKDLNRRFAVFAANAQAMQTNVVAATARIASVVGFWQGRVGAGLAAKERILKNLDPQRLLARGYAVVRMGGKVVREAAAVDIGERVEIQLHHGRLTTEVKNKQV